MTGPTLADKRRLLKALLSYYKSAPRSVRILSFLFKESIDNQKRRVRTERIIANDINAACPSRSKDADSNIAATMSKLYDSLAGFFASEDGAAHPWRITRPMPDGKVDRGNFALWFEPNVQIKPETPPHATRYLATEFWRPYLEGPQPVHILYPELRSIMDLDSETYFRHASWDRPKLLKHLGLKDDENIQLSYSFVSSGLVAGMLTILEYLSHHPGFRFEIRVIRPHEGIAAIPRAQNCILLGTTTSTELLSILETPAMRTENHGVVVKSGKRAKRHADSFRRRSDVMIQTKFGVVTRRRHPAHPRTLSNNVITILAGKHGRAIEAMASFLTSSDWMLEFRRMLGRRGVFPPQFQALFEVELNKARNGTPVVQETKLLEFIANREASPARLRA